MSKHMTLEDRNIIEDALNHQVPLAEIAKRIQKDRSSVSREVKGHRIVSKTGAYGRVSNRCKHRKKCDIYGLCESCKYNGKRMCRVCNLCNKTCPDYQEEYCQKLLAPPYVFN